MISKILHDVSEFKKQTASLKEKAPVYPKLYFESKEGVEFVTTIVHFEREGKIYARHHVESCIPTDSNSINCMYKRIVKAAEMCIQHAVQVPQYDDLIN